MACVFCPIKEGVYSVHTYTDRAGPFGAVPAPDVAPEVLADVEKRP